ncbi:MAG: hypothetical protein AAF363_08595 [Bacteroidota bacterium]
MGYERNEIYRGIGEMAYVIAHASKGFDGKDKEAFYEIIEEELKYDSWAVESRFELLEEELHPDIESAYRAALYEFKKYHDHLDNDLKEKAIRVIKRIAAVYHGHTSKVEEFIINQFEEELRQIE